MQIFRNDTRAMLSMNAIVGLALAIVIIAIVLPVGFNQFFGTNTSTWTAGTVALWGIIPLVAIVLVVVAFLPKGKLGKGA